MDLDFRELHRYSRRTLRGGYAAAMRNALLLPGLYALYRLIPAGLGMLLIARGSMQPLQFWQSGWLWQSFLVLWAVFCAGLMLPVRCGVWNWFGARLGLSPARRCFSCTRDYLHAAWVTGCAGVLCGLAAFPPAAAGYFALYALRTAAASQRAIWLFAAAQAAAAMLWSIWYALRLRVSLAAVPMLYLREPEAGAFRLIRKAVCMMDGHHRELWAIWLGYLPPMLTLVSIPFLLPCVYTDTALFWQVRVREFERDAGKEKPNA